MDTQELSSALRELVSKLHKRLRKQVYSVEGLSLTEMYTLSYLYQSPPKSPSELASLNKIKAQSMSQALARMEEAGLISRSASKEDGRKVLISLAAQGKKVVEQTRYERDEWLAEAIRTTLSEREAKALCSIIPLLQRIVDTD